MVSWEETEAFLLFIETAFSDGSKPDQKDEKGNDSADEVMKLKGLLDAGAITQEEFDTKKKELLGL